MEEEIKKFEEKKEMFERKQAEQELLPHINKVDKRFVELEGEADIPDWESMNFIPEPREAIHIDERVEMIPLIPRATPEEVMFLGEYEPPEFAAFDFWTKYGMLL